MQMSISAPSLIVIACLGISGCITTQTPTGDTDLPSVPNLETINVEGYLVYYRDLSDPCDAGSTAWQRLQEQPSGAREPIQCSETAADAAPAAEFVIPETEYVLMFAMRGKTLRSPANDVIVEELASMRDWPVQYHVLGAAGGVGQTLEALGMSRANVVKQGLVDAGIPASKIVINPYDPTLPGLRAVVRLTEEGV